MKLSDLNQALIFDDRTLEPKYEEMLSMMIVSIMNISTLVRETKQTKLSLDSPSRNDINKKNIFNVMDYILIHDTRFPGI